MVTHSHENIVCIYSNKALYCNALSLSASQYQPCQTTGSLLRGNPSRADAQMSFLPRKPSLPRASLTQQLRCGLLVCNSFYHLPTACLPLHQCFPYHICLKCPSPPSCELLKVNTSSDYSQHPTQSSSLTSSLRNDNTHRYEYLPINKGLPDSPC